MISVILPVRDAEATLEQAMTSIVEQTLADLEILVVDDGSVDRSRDIAERFSVSDGRVRVMANQLESGLVGALETGRTAASGAFVGRMDADDVADPQRFEQQLSLLRTRADLAGCGTGVRHLGTEPASERRRDYLAWLNGMTDWAMVSRDLFVECPLAHPTFCFRREALDLVGGYRDAGWPEDYDLLLRLAAAGQRFVAVPEVLQSWRDTSVRLSRTDPRYSLEAFRRCRVHHLIRAHLQGGVGGVVWGAGPTGKKLAIELVRQGGSLVAFVDVDPRKIGQEIHGVPVLDTAHAVALEGVVHLGAVARREGRESLRETVRSAGLEEGVSFVAVA